MPNNQSTNPSLTKTQLDSGRDAIVSYVESFCGDFCRQSSEVDIKRGGTKFLSSAILVLSKIAQVVNDQDDVKDLINQNYGEPGVLKLKERLEDLLQLTTDKFEKDHPLQLQISRLSTPEITRFSKQEYQEQIRDFIVKNTSLSITQYLKKNHHHFIEHHNKIFRMEAEMEEMRLRIEELQKKNLKPEEKEILKPLSIIRPKDFTALSRSSSCPELQSTFQ